MRRAFPVALLEVAAVCWPAAANAQPREPADPRPQVVLSGDVVVAKGRVVGEVVVFHGSAVIQGVVDGDVVVLDGPIVVGGQVSGSVVALDGRVVLQRSAQVGGDVLAGGPVERADGAAVGGDVRSDVRFSFSGPLAALGALLAAAAIGMSVLALLALLLLLAPRGAEAVAAAALDAPVASALWGLALLLVVPALAGLLAVSILGMPLGLAMLLALGLLWLAGLAWTAWILGRLFVRAPRSRTGAAFAGWGVTAALGLVPGLNLVWWILGSAFGLGASLVALWRARRGVPVPVPGTPRAETRGGKHRAGRVTPTAPVVPSPVAPTPPPGTGLPETPLGED